MNRFRLAVETYRALRQEGGYGRIGAFLSAIVVFIFGIGVQ